MAKLPEDVAIRVHNVHKDFHLPHHNEDSLKRRITQLFKKKDKNVDVHHALKGVTFDIKKGEFFGIVGRNGSGKSTLLKIISHIYRPTSGTADYRGKLVAFIELGVGFNPQLSGRENVFLNGALLGFSRAEMRAMYDEIVSFAELEEFMELPLKNYSSGMKVRLAFSVAIRAEADILVLDEVLAVGDAAFQRKCYEYFKQLKRDNKTIVLVSHSMGLIREYCDRAILVEDGKIASEGSPEDIADNYLQLFNKPSNDKNQRGGKRWGNQDVVIDELKVDFDTHNMAIHATLTAADKPVSDVKFGFRIKDSKEKVLAGANNLNVENSMKMDFKANETKTLHFTMPNIFGNDTYSIGATVVLSDGITTLDNWEDITTFSNTKDSVFYPIVCPATLKIVENIQ